MYNTPNLETAFLYEAQDAVQEGTKSLEDDWVNREVKVCKNCRGNRLDISDMTRCVACDGTGADMVVEYGVEGGKFFSRLTQNGIEPIKALCAAHRENERDKGLMGRAKASTVYAFMLPESARMELEFMYPDFDKWQKEGQMKKAISKVRQHYPEFLCTDIIF